MSKGQSKNKSDKFNILKNPSMFAGQPDLAKQNDDLQKAIGESRGETKQAVQDLIDNPDEKKFEKAIEAVKNDDLLPIPSKEAAIKILYEMDEIKDIFLKRFNFDNCPEDYDSLKKEVKFLAGINQYSFILMAQRLKVIRDKELFIKDGYSDFKEFIEKELPIVRQSVYNYISLVECFGVQALGQGDDNIEYSKLFAFVPLLKSDNSKINKAALIKKLFLELKQKSFRELQEEAKELKIKYGLTKITTSNDSNSDLDKIYKKIKLNINNYDKNKIQELINNLQNLLS